MTKNLPPRSTGVMIGLLAVIVGAVVPLAIATALPSGTPPAGAVTLTPSSGNSATTFNVVPPAGAACPGDNTQGFLYHTFITPFGNDPADFVYSGSGTPSGEPAFTNNLANSIGTRSRNITPGLGDGLLIAVSNQTFSNALYAGLTPGVYTLGIACTQPDASFVVQTMRFWSTEITITAEAGAGPNDFTYVLGNVPPTTTTLPPTTTTTTTLPPTTTTTTTLPPTTTTTTLPPTTTTTTLPPTTTTTTLPPTTTTLPPTTTTTTTLPPTTPTVPPTTTTLPPTTTTTLPPTTTTTTTTTTTLPPTTTTTTVPPTTVPPKPPKPPTVFDATCVGGRFRQSVDGTLRTGWWLWGMPRVAVFTPDGRRPKPIVGVIIDQDVRETSTAAGVAASRSSEASWHRGWWYGGRRDTTCITEPFTNGSGGQSVIEFTIRFL